MNDKASATQVSQRDEEQRQLSEKADQLLEDLAKSDDLLGLANTSRTEAREAQNDIASTMLDVLRTQLKRL